MRSSLLSLLLLLAPTVAAGPLQDSRPPGTLPEPEEPTSGDPEITDAALNQRLLDEQAVFEPLQARWTNAVQGHYFECRELREAGATPAEFPPPPVHEFFPIFYTLGEEGNGPARLWLLRAARDVIEEQEELHAFYGEQFRALASDNASGIYITEVLEELQRVRKVLGEETVLDVLHLIQDRSRRRSTVARAFWAEAELLTAGEGLLDPVRVARAEELWRVLVDGYPGTEAARFAGTPLTNSQLEAMRGAQLAWAEEALALHAAGAPVADWPRLPGAEFAPILTTIAGAGHPVARQWVNRFFPALDQAQREGLPQALALEVAFLWKRFGSFNEPWNELKHTLLQVLYTCFPGDPSNLSTLEELEARRGSYPLDPVLELLDGLVASEPEAPVGDMARLTLARVLACSRRAADLERATELFAALQEDAAEPDLRFKAREGGLEHSWTMPGAAVPTINVNDSDGLPVSTLNYRGKVLVLFFWTLERPGSEELFPLIDGLVREHPPEEFAILGIGCQLMGPKRYRKLSAEKGISWRNALLQKQKNHVAAQFGVTEFPQLVVVDAEGVIRGRGLGFDGTKALVASLVEERAAAEVAAARAGGVTGRIRLVGEREPRPPIDIPEAQEIPCGGRERPLDRTDRALRLSPDGGLADVVVTVEREGGDPVTSTQRVVLDQVRCRFEPHVLVVPPGTRLSVVNSDRTPRSIQARTRSNGSFNVVLPPGAKHDLKLRVPESFEIRSDSHPWMSAWIVVSDAEYRGVTDADGRFELSGLAPGSYVARWWHEVLGEGVSERFVVPERGKARLDLELGGD